MVLNDKLYNVVKWALIIVVPALLTLVSTLGQIYDVDMEKTILAISAISTFLGVITGISNYNYKKEN